MTIMFVQLKSVSHNVKVPLVVHSDLASIDFFDFKIEKSKRGEKIKIPLSLALFLIKKNAVSLDESSLPTLSEINKIAWLEMKGNELQKVSKDFYVKSSLLVWSASKNPYDFESERRLRFIKALLMDIVKSRLQKIVKLALSNPVPSRDIIENLTLEEEVLYSTMCNIISSWLRYMRELVEGKIYEREHTEY